MNHVRCPTCQTLFRVNLEQLAARGGRVRCGQCAGVFNALDQATVEMDDPALAAQPDPALYASPQDNYSLAEETSTEKFPATEPEFRRGTDSDFPDDDDPPDHTRSDTAGWADDRPDLQLSPAPKHSRGIVWGLALTLLLLLTVLQSVWVFRSNLAVSFPVLRPHLVGLCLRLGCTMPLPKEPSLVGIEASELHPVMPDQSLFRLSATLRNRASFLQEYPFLELTLTDTRDAPIARRVFAPEEYLPAQMSPNTGFTAGADLPLSLSLDTSPLNPAGYRLYVFYP